MPLCQGPFGYSAFCGYALYRRPEQASWQFSRPDFTPFSWWNASNRLPLDQWKKVMKPGPLIQISSMPGARIISLMGLWTSPQCVPNVEIVVLLLRRETNGESCCGRRNVVDLDLKDRGNKWIFGYCPTRNYRIVLHHFHKFDDMRRALVFDKMWLC